ncbi:S-layer homology domain-containing protein [Paenibacillus sp. P25]|nr:S-layer homology domain-containing protein [Paenibacillus sp. P25]
MKKAAALTLSAVLMSGLTFGTAFAFTDVEDGQLEAVSALQARGVVSGIDQDHFAPNEKISFAESVQMMVKALDLNLDLIKFKSQPKASGIYTHIADDAWYADAFVIAYYNGVEIPKDVNPGATITREQFANLLVSALEKKGNFPMIKLISDVKDEDQITPEYQGRVLRPLHYKIAQKDSSGAFNPKSVLTRGEAATWVYNAANVLVAHSQKPPVANDEMTFAVEKVNDEVNKVTLSRSEKSSAGYGIEINSIQFRDGQALISYSVSDPRPDQMNAAVITVPKAVTYISSKYTPVIEPAVAN